MLKFGVAWRKRATGCSAFEAIRHRRTSLPQPFAGATNALEVGDETIQGGRINWRLLGGALIQQSEGNPPGEFLLLKELTEARRRVPSAIR